MWNVFPDQIKFYCMLEYFLSPAKADLFLHLHVCNAFICKYLALDRTQLYSAQVCMWTCINLMQQTFVNFSCKFLEHVSGYKTCSTSWCFLSGPEQVCPNHSRNDLSFYIRRWWPSKYEIGHLQEIYVTDLSLDTTLNKVLILTSLSPVT